VPSAAEILQGLATITNAFWPLAVLWHVYFGALAVAVLFGWHPSQRLVGALLLPPLASVSALAWLAGNPFNAVVLGLLLVVQVALLHTLRITPVERAAPAWIVFGLLLLGFGWAYPHFLAGMPGAAYLYAAPLGLVPCPTLSLVIGISIVFRGVGSRWWSAVLAAAALFYGTLGTLYLGVMIDWVLTVGGVGLFVLLVRQSPASTPVFRAAGQETK
jgi:hypothetical protein